MQYKKVKKTTCDTRTYNIANKYLRGNNWSQKEINWKRRKGYGKNFNGGFRHPNWKMQKCKKQWMTNFKLKYSVSHFGTWVEYDKL